MSPSEIVTLHLLVGRGAVVHGFGEELLAVAIARAFDQPSHLVRHVLAIDGDAGRTALAARRGTLEATFVRPMQLVPPMHAVALERIVDESGALRLFGAIPDDPSRLFVEERLPGIRAQLHVWYDDEKHDEARDEPTVALLTPSGRDIAPSLGPIVASLAGLPHGTVIDGHVIAFEDEETMVDLPRLERAAREAVAIDPGASLFVGFDLLVREGISLLDHPLEERRFLLEGLAEAHGLAITRISAVHDHDDLERHYVETLARGGLGIIAKDRASAYEFGRRTGSWLKAPGEPETLLAVIRYAGRGVDGPTGPPGELTFGVWLADAEETRLVNIGRAECALDEEDLERLQRRLRTLRGQRFGPNYEIEPRIVCELEYDAVRVAPRTDAGYTVRIACIRCVRWDLEAADAATVADVERRHRALQRARSLGIQGGGRREEGGGMSSRDE
jgi:ATP-dependent DNA ligase